MAHPAFGRETPEVMDLIKDSMKDLRDDMEELLIEIDAKSVEFVKLRRLLIPQGSATRNFSLRSTLR